MKITQITLNDVRNFFQGNYYHMLKQENRLDADHIKEQAEYRAYLCQDCLEVGKCRHCGCPTPNLFYAPNKVDSLGRWGKMLSAALWKKFKSSNAGYKIFTKAKEENEQMQNESTEQFQLQKRLLEGEPAARDPYEGLPVPSKGSERTVENNVGNSVDSLTRVEIRESSSLPEGGSDKDGLSE